MPASLAVLFALCAGDAILLPTTRVSQDEAREGTPTWTGFDFGDVDIDSNPSLWHLGVKLENLKIEVGAMLMPVQAVLFCYLCFGNFKVGGGGEGLGSQARADFFYTLETNPISVAGRGGIWRRWRRQ